MTIFKKTNKKIESTLDRYMEIVNPKFSKKLLTKDDRVLLKIFHKNIDDVMKRMIESVGNAGLGWNKKRFKDIEPYYKAFLFISWKYKKDKHVPSVEVDNVWHYHILHTKKYTSDCLQLFGKYLHHNPD